MAMLSLLLTTTARRMQFLWLGWILLGGFHWQQQQQHHVVAAAGDADGAALRTKTRGQSARHVQRSPANLGNVGIDLQLQQQQQQQQSDDGEEETNSRHEVHRIHVQSRNLRSADTTSGSGHSNSHPHQQHPIPRQLKPIVATRTGAPTLAPVGPIVDGFHCLLLKKHIQIQTPQPDGKVNTTMDEEWNCQLLAIPPPPPSTTTTTTATISTTSSTKGSTSQDNASSPWRRPHVGSIVKLVGLEGWLDALQKDDEKKTKTRDNSGSVNRQMRVTSNSTTTDQDGTVLKKKKFDRLIKRFAQSGKTELFSRIATLEGDTLYLSPNDMDDGLDGVTHNIFGDNNDIDLLDRVTGMSLLERLKARRGGNTTATSSSNGNKRNRRHRQLIGNSTLTESKLLHRQLQDDGQVPTTGTKNVLVVRPYEGGSFSEADVARYVFGAGAPSDEMNLRSWMSACSHGQVDFQPGSGYPNVNNGVITVTVETPLSDGDSAILSEMWQKAESAMGLGGGDGNYIEDHFDHVLVCLPAGTPGSWIAYGWMNYWLTAYNDEWCSSPSSQMHEVGHNLNLAHAGMYDNEYGDGSGFMGVSYLEQNGPKKCYNGAKHWHLGWYKDQALDYNPLLEGPITVTLIGVDDYGTRTDDAFVLIRIGDGNTNQDDDSAWYVSYNRAKGINSGTNTGPDTVFVHSDDGLEDDRGSQSWVLASLTSGMDTNLVNYKDSGKNLKIVFRTQSDDLNSVSLDIFFEGEEGGLTYRNNAGPPPTPLPTTPPLPIPTAPPTPIPTIPPPTSLPTNPPTLPPTSEPTVEPTDPPTFPQPTGNPTVPPVPQPMPTTVPTPPPTIPPRTNNPTMAPTLPPPTPQPTNIPSKSPTPQPTPDPTRKPTHSPTRVPTSPPTHSPTIEPTGPPKQKPSAPPTNNPLDRPSSEPTHLPSPSDVPSPKPSMFPSSSSSATPSIRRSEAPSVRPSISSSSPPSAFPSTAPSNVPFARPSTSPSSHPSFSPTSEPSNVPSLQPSEPSPITTRFRNWFRIRNPSSIKQMDTPTAEPSSPPSSSPSESLSTSALDDLGMTPSTTSPMTTRFRKWFSIRNEESRENN